MQVFCVFFIICLAFLARSESGDFVRVDQIRSLKAIYGQDKVLIQSKAKVGVIGSGVDYNHPLIARFLGHRQAIELDLQKIEDLRKQLRYDNFSSKNKFTQTKNLYFAMSRNVGFPRWTDQALGTIEPMDRIIENGQMSDQQEHDTRVTSRIVSDRQDVQVYFVRRMFGSEKDILDVKKVIDEFSKTGVQVVNLSFSSPCGQLPKEEEAWGQVFKKYAHMIFVVAAGNSGRNIDYVDHCPAKYSRDFSNVISVTSLDGDGNISMNVNPETGRDQVVNYGLTVDVAIPADHLPVLVPFQYSGWINNEKGWTSLAAAEVSRVLIAAIADGYKVDPMTVKKQLQHTSQKRRQLKELVGSGGRVDETAFRLSLEQ